MMKRGYSKYLSLGPIMGVGGLAVIIPPSALTVLLATLGRTDVGDLLIAGVIPGVILAAMYGVLIWAWTVIDPDAAPMYYAAQISRREKLRLFVVDVVPMIVIIVFSVLIMVTGWSTPTEAAALGAVSVIVCAICYGDMTWQAFVKSLDGTLRVTVMAFLVILGSATFAQVLAFTGASSGLMNWAISFHVTPIGMLLVMIGVIVFLGSFMDPLSKMLLTAPIFFPLAKTLGFDLTWFGLIMLLSLEIGYTTPPFGLLLFVMKGVSPPGTTMRDIYLAGMPFIACVMLLIAMIIVFPPIATWLPAISH
jgi:tripartite ATP-independent transporter DctM subunit